MFKILASVALCCTALSAHAAFPERAIRLVIGYPAGASVDGAARILARHMEKELGQSVVVESRAGASGLLGAAAVANSQPDGYTVYMGAAGTFTVTPFLSNDAGVEPLSRLEPIGGVVRVTNVLLVNRDLPVTSFSELIEYARANPGKVTYGSSGEGSSSHISGEMLAQMSGTSMVHVPYKGAAPAVSDLLGGHISMFFDVTATGQRYAQHERLMALSVTSKVRNPALPNLPSIAEQGYPDYEVTSWLGLFVPKGTPVDVSEKLAGTLRLIRDDPAFKKQMADNGFDEFAVNGAGLAQRIEDESKTYSALLLKK